MFGSLFYFASVHDELFDGCAERVQRRASENGVAGGRLGSFGIRFPAMSWVENDSFSLPLFRLGRISCCSDDAASVCEKWDAESDGAVESLADEEVAVVECGRGDFDYDFVVLWLRFGLVDDLERVVYFAGLALDLFDDQCFWHIGSEVTVLLDGLVG